MGIEDSEIKTKVSPFAIREDEIKQSDGFDGYVSINQVVNKIDRGHLGEVEYKILEIVNKYEFITSRQINQILELENMGFNKNRKLTNKLDQMLKGKLLTRYYFGTFGEKAAYRVYCLDKNGKYLLEAREVKVDWKPTDNTKSVGVMKRRLAANQFLIAYKMKSENYFKDEAKSEIVDKENNTSIKSNGLLVLGKEASKISIVVESVRREEDWKKTFKYRMETYKNFLENFKIGDSNFNEKPYLVFVCEDKKHMAEVYKEICLNKQNTEEKIYFTYDILQIQESLEDTWFEFVEKEDKIVLQALNIPILK